MDIMIDVAMNRRGRLQREDGLVIQLLEESGQSGRVVVLCPRDPKVLHMECC